MTDQEAPPESAYALGDVVRDGSRNRVGRVMGEVGGRVQLRPLNGGREWDALEADLSPAAQSDAMSGAVAEVNALSRWEVGAG